MLTSTRICAPISFCQAAETFPSRASRNVTLTLRKMCWYLQTCLQSQLRWLSRRPVSKSHRFSGDLYANVMLTRGTNISSSAPRSVTLTTARIRTPIDGPSFHPPRGTSTSRLMSNASVVQKRGSRSPANSFKDSETLTSKDVPDGLLEDTVCLMVSKPSVSNRASGSTRLQHDMRQYRSFFKNEPLTFRVEAPPRSRSILGSTQKDARKRE